MPASLPAYFDRQFSGGDLRLGKVQARNNSFTSYAVTYRSEKLRISGIMNVPRGKGPFPAIVLAHGYIDPAKYFSGQGMPRERDALAEAGYIALHTDYRNHATSSDDPNLNKNFRAGYSVDVINAVNALRETTAIPVDDNRIGLMGRSMGGGVVYKALEMAPGLVDAAVVYAAVSSREADNFAQFGNYPSSAPNNTELWNENSSRPYFDRITEPVLIVHGTQDSTCPPEWATATHQAMKAAGVDVGIQWYSGEEHMFEAKFNDAMNNTVRYFDQRVK